MTVAQLHEGACKAQRHVERVIGRDDYGAIGNAGDANCDVAVCNRFDPNVGFDVGERQRAAVVEKKQKFRRQRTQRRVALQFRSKLHGHGVGVESASRRGRRAAT